MNVRSLTATVAATLALMPCLGGVAAAKEPGGPGRVPRSSCPTVDYEELRAPYVFRTDLTEQQLETDFVDDVTGLAASGFRPLRLAGYQDHGQGAVRHAVGPDGRTAVARELGRSRSTSWRRTTRRSTDGFRITDISGFNTPDGVRYNTIWENNMAGVGWRVTFDVTADELEDLSDTYAAQGFAPERVEGYRGGDGEAALRRHLDQRQEVRRALPRIDDRGGVQAPVQRLQRVWATARCTSTPPPWTGR